MPTEEQREYHRAYYVRNRDRMLARQKAWAKLPEVRARTNAYVRAAYRKNPEAQLKALVKAAKDRCAKNGLEFRLRAEDLLPLPERCPLLDVKLVYNAEARSDFGPSIDRKDSTKGYTPDNAWIVSWRANRIKGDASLAELQLIATNLATARKGG